MKLVIATSAFAVMGMIIYLMRSYTAYISLVFALVLTLYLMLMLKFKRGNISKAIPSIFSIIIISSPAVIGIILLFEGLLQWRAAILIIIGLGLALTFWSNLLTIPLSLYSKAVEQNGSFIHGDLPKVSIIIPAYNEEKVIARTVESVLETDYPNKEVIVVDDGSTDNTASILEAYKDRILVLSKQNGGKASALNYGIQYATGQIVVVVDADTALTRDSLRQLVSSFTRDRVAAVAGNVKVANRRNLLTKCQALEYIISIQLFRRALDAFGTVTVVPGALGAFRRDILDQTGFYDTNTLTEDFDTTIKALKTGNVVQANSRALAYTEAPQTLRDFYRQRMRWYRGNFQCFYKHIDAFVNPRYGSFYALGFPFMLVSMLLLPLAGLTIWISAAYMATLGYGIFLAEVFALFALLQVLLALLAIRIEEDDPKLALYAPLFVFGYKQFVDLLTIKALIDVLLRRKLQWTRASRSDIVY